MMDSYDRLHHLLKREFLPTLRADGFKGSGTTLRRLKGERLDVVNIQGSVHGGKCCVNVATHFMFLPSPGGGEVVDPYKFRESHCVFRGRLHEESEADRWWSYGANETEAAASVASIVDLYQRRGSLFFGWFEPFPDAFEQIQPEHIETGDLSAMPTKGTVLYFALTMARIMSHLGRLERCREFAEVGLRHLGGAIGLEAELEQLRGAG